MSVGELLALPDYRIEVSHPERGEAEDVLAEFEEELAKARAELPPHAAAPDTERHQPSVAGEPPPAAEEPVASGLPKAPDPDNAILLKDLAGLAPNERKKILILKDEVISPKHLRSHFPKNPWCRLFQIAKTTFMWVSHQPDGKGTGPPNRSWGQGALYD